MAPLARAVVHASIGAPRTQRHRRGRRKGLERLGPLNTLRSARARARASGAWHLGAAAAKAFGALGSRAVVRVLNGTTGRRWVPARQPQKALGSHGLVNTQWDLRKLVRTRRLAPGCGSRKGRKRPGAACNGARVGNKQQNTRNRRRRGRHMGHRRPGLSTAQRNAFKCALTLRLAPGQST